MRAAKIDFEVVQGEGLPPGRRAIAPRHKRPYQVFTAQDRWTTTLYPKWNRHTFKSSPFPLKGVYSTAGWWNCDPVELHCELAKARLTQLPEHHAISHWSAALLWNLVDLWLPLKQLSFTSHGDGARATRRGPVRIFATRLDPCDVEFVRFFDRNRRPSLHGVVFMTSIPRTVVDCARLLAPEVGLWLAESAVACGYTNAQELRDVVERCSGMTGIGKARRALEWVELQWPAAIVPQPRWAYLRKPPVERFFDDRLHEAQAPRLRAIARGREAHARKAAEREARAREASARITPAERPARS